MNVHEQIMNNESFGSLPKREYSLVQYIYAVFLNQAVSDSLIAMFNLSVSFFASVFFTFHHNDFKNSKVSITDRLQLNHDKL